MFISFDGYFTPASALWWLLVLMLSPGRQETEVATSFVRSVIMVQVDAGKRMVDEGGWADEEEGGGQMEPNSNISYKEKLN